MAKLPKARYSAEFKIQAVKMAVDNGLGVTETARRLSISDKTLANWVARYRTDKAGFQNESVLSAEESELSRLRRENALLRMERDILKKAAAYFAKESCKVWRCGKNAIRISGPLCVSCTALFCKRILFLAKSIACAALPQRCGAQACHSRCTPANPPNIQCCTFAR